MKFYFDNQNEVNLHTFQDIKEIRPLQQLKDYYNTGDAEFVHSTEYSEIGIYLIEVSKFTHQWTGNNIWNHSFSTLENIPQHVLASVKNNKIRIVILSIVEGDHFVKDRWDAFSALTNSVKALGIPPSGLLIVTGNVKSNLEYQRWCVTHGEEQLIEFIGGTEGIDTYRTADSISAKHANSFKNHYLYSSLNRAHRQSRTEHLYMLAKENILNVGLVSGGVHFDQNIHFPKFLKVNMLEWVSLLNAHYPRSVDIDPATLKINNQANNVNFDIYKQALLSVVTETYFEEPGLYFSEKTFKPILAGSPQLILGQPAALDYLKNKFNINLYFNGIDTSFDNIDDPADRFVQFHNALLNWIKLDNNRRKKIYENLFGQLEENLNTIRNTNFKKIIVNDIINSSVEYFKGKK